MVNNLYFLGTNSILFTANFEKTEEFVKLKEIAIYKLAKLLAKKGYYWKFIY
jgi:hypothetical protein